ncbi:MAG: hypothetical protein KDI44_16395 [Thiothrix sp.]|nr:hypothetical protein [Thiothrix sp.]
MSEFDRIILVLREDFGFPFSSRFAEKMLDLWFSSQGYCYTGAHLRNLPWMIAYFGPTESIYGQYIGSDTELVRAIIKQVSGARITPEGQLRHDGTGYFNLKLQCLHHRMTEISAEGMLSERMTLRVMDFSATNFAGEAPALYEKKIRFDPERFERLIHTAPERARRNRALLDLARQVAEKWRPTTHGDNA